MTGENIFTLMQQFPYQGELNWIGLRPVRKQEMLAVEQVLVNCQTGLVGDHYAGRSGKRQVTLIQWEHLLVLESFLGRKVSPSVFRRNLVIKGINLLSLKNRQFILGSAIFKTTGLCHPCSRMEEALGEGGYNAMRNHGGINCQVMQSGLITIGDKLTVIEQQVSA